MFRWVIVRKKKRKARPRLVARTYAAHKEAARSLITARAAQFASAYGFTYGRIAIKNTRRSWGSCSAKGNLNFHYKLLFLPACLRDYVILHELCHLRELNHSARFWAVMAAYMPDARERALTLRRLERARGTAVPALLTYAKEHMCSACALQDERPTVFVPPEGEGGEGAVG